MLNEVHVCFKNTHAIDLEGLPVRCLIVVIEYMLDIYWHWIMLCVYHVFPHNTEFPSDEIVKFLVGFTNKGNQEFTVQSLEASFRYPQDFQFYIQNVCWNTAVVHRLTVL